MTHSATSKARELVIKPYYQRLARLSHSKEHVSQLITERLRAEIGAADPRIGVQPLTFLLAHNWGNEDAQALLATQYNPERRKAMTWFEREMSKVNHAEHVALNEAGNYRWCTLCAPNPAAG